MVWLSPKCDNDQRPTFDAILVQILALELKLEGPYVGRGINIVCACLVVPHEALPQTVISRICVPTNFQPVLLSSRNGQYYL